MQNKHVEQRLLGIQNILNGVHGASVSMSSSSSGTEREKFIKRFLEVVLPPVFRFGTGDATDTHGRRSGQLDVVIEYPIAPTLPGDTSKDSPRLYLAESVAAVIEVKSDISAQWSEALSTASNLSSLERVLYPTIIIDNLPNEKIPIFIAGYKGWKRMKTLEEKLNDNPNISGILVIDKGLFASSENFGSIRAEGPWGLWGLICTLHKITNSLHAVSTDPLSYHQSLQKPKPPQIRT